MPTIITKTIGSGGDYSDPATWEAAISADLVAADEQWVGKLKNQLFTGGSSRLTIDGHTVDATRNIILKCDTGASFRDNAGVRSNALDWNSSNGAALESTDPYTNTIENHCQYTEFHDLQIKGGNVNSGIALNTIYANNILVKHCILMSRYCVYISGTANHRFFNTLFHSYGSNGDISTGGFINSHTFRSCTFVSSTGSSNSALLVGYGVATVENCACFGFAAFHSTTGGGSYAGGHNATDLGSAPGSSNITGLTFADQFENSTNDFRAKSTGSLQAGTQDATNTPDDISGLPRGVSPSWIGAWSLPDPTVWTQQVNDTFSDPNTTLISAHTPDSGGSYTVVGAGTYWIFGAVTSTPDTGPNYAIHSATVSSKQAVEVTISETSGYSTLLLLVGISGGNMSGYAVVCTNNFGSAIYKFTGSGQAVTSLATDSTAFANGDVMRAEYDPDTDTISVFKNGVFIWSYADSTYTSGGVGHGMGGPGFGFDNWNAYDVSGGGDVTPPTLDSATIETDGTTLTLVFDEAVTGDETGFSITPDGGAATMSYTSGSGTDTLIFTLSRTILSTETVTLDYEDGTGIIVDTSSNPLADITDFAVTNNSTQVPGLTAGVASFESSGPDGISVSATDATGGTESYSYQWERNEDGGSFSSLSGKTALTCDDDTATTPGVVYGYRLVYDDTVDTVTSNTVTASFYTGGPLTGGGNSVFQSNIIRGVK